MGKGEEEERIIKLSIWNLLDNGLGSSYICCLMFFVLLVEGNGGEDRNRSLLICIDIKYE